MLLNLKANDDANHFICELQLVHKKMLVTREELGGHDAYNEFRTASEFLELVQEGAEAGVTAGLERELAAARKDRNGKKCKELKARIERIKALDAEIKELEAAEAAAFDGDDFDEGDRLHGELEARRARFQELTAKAAGGDAVDAPVVKKATDGASAPSEAEPIKVLQSITDASAVATASMPPLDPSKLVELRTLEGHSGTVCCGVHCTFVMMCLRRRSGALPCFRTGGASFLGRTTRHSRCGTWRPENAWRRCKGTLTECVAASAVFCVDVCAL